MDLLEILVNQGLLHKSNGQYFWMQSSYPSANISLRTATADRVQLRHLINGKYEIFGTVDKISSFWMVHPEAIYLHEGLSYLVDELDLINNTAALHLVEEDYYTEPQEAMDVEILSRQNETPATNCLLGYGDLRITNLVTGYKKIKNTTHEVLGLEKIDLPAYTFDTTGMWLVLAERLVKQLRENGLWLNDANDYGSDWADIRLQVRERDGRLCRHCGKPEKGSQHHIHHIVPFRMLTERAAANRLDNLITLCSNCHQLAEMHTYVRSGLTGLAYALRHLLPLHLMCDSHDIEVHGDPQSGLFEGRPALILLDAIPGGIGLSRLAYDMIISTLPNVFSFIQACTCLDGCPSCIGPAGEQGYGGKKETLALLELIIHG